MLDNKRGQLGMDTGRNFVVGLLALLVVGVAIAIVLASLGTVSLATDAYSVTGETGATIAAAGYELANAGAYDFGSPVITSAVNYTDGTTILAGNYTLSDAGVLTNATATTYANVSLNYTYTAGNEIGLITGNGTSAMSDFFSNTSTWLALLGVMIIMLLISVVVIVVNKFGR